jgi:hypothetical protein
VTTPAVAFQHALRLCVAKGCPVTA